MLGELKYNSSLLIQKMTRGFRVWRQYKEVIHRRKIDKMMSEFKVMREKLHTNSKIVIWHQWRLFKRRKAIKAEKKKKKAEALNAKKKGKYGGYTRKTNASPAPVANATATPQKASSSLNQTPSKPELSQTLAAGNKLPALNLSIDSDISRANLSATI